MRHIPSRQTLAGALAGGAVAAAISVGPAVAEQTARIAATITGKDIANNSVTSADVRDGTLAGKDVLDGGLSGADVGTGSLTGDDIARESIGGDDIRADSLDGSDILDTLTGIDIRDGSLDDADIRDGGLTGGDIRDGGLTGGDVGDDTLTGADIDESTLDIERSAPDPDAGRLIPFRVALAAGETRSIATHGPLSVDAQCHENVGGRDRVRLLVRTTEPNSVMSARSSHPGGHGLSHLQPTTPADARQIVSFDFSTSSETWATRDPVSGYVLDSDGEHWIGADSDSLALVLNYAGAKCFAIGVLRTN